MRDREGWGRGEREASVVQPAADLPVAMEFFKGPWGESAEALVSVLGWALRLHGASELFAPQPLLPRPAYTREAGRQGGRQGVYQIRLYARGRQAGRGYIT